MIGFVRFPRGTLAATLFALAVCVPSGLRAEAPSIATLTGFSGIEFGDSVDRAREKLPGLKTLSAEERMPAAAFASPHLQRFLHEGYQLDGVELPLRVELRFWKDRLWAFLVYFEAKDAAAVLQQLEKMYGPRTSGIADRPIWKDDRVTLQAVSKAGWYGATSDAVSEDARAWFFQALSGGDTSSIVPAAATPAEKPES